MYLGHLSLFDVAGHGTSLNSLIITFITESSTLGDNEKGGILMVILIGSCIIIKKEKAMWQSNLVHIMTVNCYG